MSFVNIITDFVLFCNIGAKNKFTVRTAGAGSGFLALTIDGPSKVALSCKEVDDGYEFSYTPFSPGKYLISIKYGNINIAGSPYVSEITGTLFSLFLSSIFILHKLNYLSLK